MSLSLLVVDDDAEFVERLRPRFEAAGWRVWWAADGDAALRLIGDSPGGAAAAMIDLHLPGMSGFELIREMATRYPAMPILAVSAIYREFYLDIARNVGAQSARRKSEAGSEVTAEEWLRVVTDLVESAGGQESPT